MNDGIRVGITGGSGIVGAAIVRHLVAEGTDVRALARSADSAAALAEMGTVPDDGDILDHGSLVEAFTGCDVVYHVAGINEMCSADPERMYRANVEGTRTVLRACAAADVRRLVYTSSAVTVGEEGGVLADEGTVHRGKYLSHYERSKHHAELALFAEKSSVEVVAVNPSSVQGPGRATGTGGIILDVLRGKLPVLIESKVSMVDIDDCARGHLLAARSGKPGERYILSGFTASVSEAIDMAAEILGRPVKVRMIPLWMARAGVAVAETGGRLLGKKLPFCSEMIRVVSHGHVYDGSKATRDLGLEYTPARNTIAAMVAWFSEEGLL